MNADFNDHQPPGAYAKPAHTLMRTLFNFLGLVLLYLLSTGPAGWIETEVPATHAALAVIYSPLRLMCEVCPPAGYALLFYLSVIWRIPIDL